MHAVLRKIYYVVIAFVARVLTPIRFRSYFRNNAVRKLQIGAGPTRMPGWLISDIEPPSLSVGYLDATRRYPFADASFDYIHSEHMIEHVPWRGGLAMLQECHRVLKPGGRIRIATPDLKVLLDLYYPDRETPMSIRYIRWITDRLIPGAPAGYNPIFVINNAVRSWGHQFFYDGDLLMQTLRSAGFTDIVRMAPGQSTDPNLRGIEMHGVNIGDEEINAFETMVYEARRAI